MDLFFRKSGEGFPLIILHGLYGSSDNWMSVAKTLAEHFTVYLIDQRNHGQSPHADSHTYEDMVSDLNAFMEAQQIQKAILIGHSMGGKTAMRFTLEYPEKVQKLVVVDIAPKDYSGYRNYGKVTADHEEILEKLLSVDLPELKNRNDINTVLEKHFEDVRLRMFLLKNIRKLSKQSYGWKMNLEVLRRDLSEIMNGFTDVAATSQHDVLFIKGEKSPYIDEDDTMIIRKYFPNSEIVTIPEAGHWVHYEQPDILLKTLDYFLLD